jgi:hypothetical protein
MAVSAAALAGLSGGGIGQSVLGAGAFVQAILTEYAEMPTITLKGIHPLTGADIPTLPQRALQFWPETLTDTMEISYTPKNLPGTSHAIMQWMFNGGRTIAFEIRLLRDMQPPVVQDENKSAVLTKADPSDPEFGSPERNTNIPYMLRFLRGFCYPNYEDAGDGFTTVAPPPICILDVPGTPLNEDGRSTIFAVMTQCDITYNKMWPGVNKQPQLKDVTVSVSFKQIIQNPGNSTPFSWKSWEDQSKTDGVDIASESQSGKYPGAGEAVDSSTGA